MGTIYVCEGCHNGFSRELPAVFTLFKGKQTAGVMATALDLCPDCWYALMKSEPDVRQGVPVTDKGELDRMRPEEWRKVYAASRLTLRNIRKVPQVRPAGGGGAVLPQAEPPV